MRTCSCFLGTALTVIAVAGLQSPSAFAHGPPILTVRGHAAWNQRSGLPEGGNSTYQASINAWLDSDGTAYGVIEWTWETNPLPGGGGQTISGYPWTVAVDAIYVIDDHFIYVTGVVINSGQVPGDVGVSVGFLVKDNGDGVNDPSDELDGTPIDAGNLTIR